MTINLYQNPDNEKSSLRMGSSGFILSVGILVVTILVLIGLKITSYVLVKNNAALKDMIQQESTKLAGSNELENFIGLQNRLTQIKNNLQIKNNGVTRPQMSTMLAHLQNDLGTGIVVSSFKYEGGKVIVDFNSNTFSDVSKQIVNFKKSEYFTNASLSALKRGEKDIVCEMVMGVK